MDESPLQDLSVPRSPDLERGDNTDFLRNSLVRDFSWQGLTVTVKDRETKVARDLINGVCGDVRQGMYFLSLLFCGVVLMDIGLQGRWWH